MTDEEADPTRRFDQAVPDEGTIVSQNEPTGSSTLITPTAESRLPPGADPNELASNKLRYRLVWLLFALILVWLVINNIHLFSQTASVGLGARWVGHSQLVSWVAPDLSSSVNPDDAILSIDGVPMDAHFRFRQVVREFDIGESHLFRFSRDGRPYELEIETEPVSSDYVLNNVSNGILIPMGFFSVGLLLFIFKPNNRLTVLGAISFALIAASTSPIYFISYAEGAFPVVLIWQIGYFLSLLSGVVLLHFMLYFPKPSRLVKAFPRLPFIIYLPFLIYVLPTEIAQQASWNGLTAFDIFYTTKALFLGDYFYTPYLVADVIVLFVNYRDAHELGRRRLRLLMLAVPLAILPFVFVDYLLPPIERLFEFSLFRSSGSRDFFGNSLILAVPPIFAYAVVKHRVIPVSFIIRIGLRYLFARNGLRLLLILPALGIVGNILSDPDRTISDLILRNTPLFYACVISAIAIALLSRYKLSEWIDRRFFREQYDQDRLVRKMIESVKESDSMTVLSRLVSSHIQTAMHPSSINFFYEDQQNSDFSLGFSSSGISGKMKLDAGSPILQFMQEQRGSIDFPSSQTAPLGSNETDWLERLGTRLLIPMHGPQGRLAGFFSLGDKMSELAYSERDKELLNTLADQIAIVQENLSLRDRVRQDQRVRTEVFARLERESINLLKECPQCGRCFDLSAAKCDQDHAELILTLPVERTIESRYRLDRLLGRGGMGAVYTATDLRIGRTVAVKILGGSLFGNRAAQSRFEREARAAGSLHHRNIVTVFDYGVLSTEGAFIVMELVEGETLAQVAACGAGSSEKQLVDWFCQILDGVAAAHAAGVIHRDLKPDNILVSRRDNDDARLCILDFGLARFSGTESANSVTLPGMIMGTLGYMSPEQLEGKPIDERSDLFSCGVIMYECLFGEKPFPGSSYLEIIQSMNVRTLTSISGPFRAFFQRSLAIDPQDRVSSAAEMKSLLVAAAQHAN